MISLLNILLQAAPAVASQTPSWATPIMFLLIGVIFYFFMLRPNLRKQKAQKVFLTSVKAGDQVVTNAGLHGKVVDVQSDNTFLLDIDKGVQVRFDTTAISYELSKRYLTAK